MKSLSKWVIASLMIASCQYAVAQKSAFISLDSLLSVMPEMDSAKAESAKHYQMLSVELETMQKDLNQKLTEYQANQAKYTDLIRQTKEKELQDLNQRIQDYQTQAQTEFQKKNEDLTKPINDKAKKAIAKVAKSKGYKMVIDTSIGVLLYYDEADDIFKAVKAELGIK